MPNKKTTVLFILMTLLLFVGCKDNRSCSYDSATETLKCSEATYKTVQVNGKTWLAENLNWPVVDSSFCYANNFGNCTKYGRLYTWGAAMNLTSKTSENPQKGICPSGWRLPTSQEFESALNSTDGKKLNIIRAGFRYNNDSYVDENKSASFWTSSEFDSTRAYLVRVLVEQSMLEHYSKTIASSIRCVMD